MSYTQFHVKIKQTLDQDIAEYICCGIKECVGTLLCQQQVTCNI